MKSKKSAEEFVEILNGLKKKIIQRIHKLIGDREISLSDGLRVYHIFTPQRIYRTRELAVIAGYKKGFVRVANGRKVVMWIAEDNFFTQELLFILGKLYNGGYDLV